MSDQRQIRRHPAEILRISFEHPTSGERAEATAWDASLGGMFLETSTLLDEGALITLEISTADARVSADARVLWRRATSEGDGRPMGMAIRFIDLPDDVSVALNRALQRGMAEKTILGIGGATQEPTQPGIMPGIVTPERVPRETQIGVAPPANAPEKPRLVISDTSLPETPAAPSADIPKADIPKADTPKADIPKADTPKADTPKAEPSRVPARSRPSSEPPPPPGTSGVFGRIVLLLVLGGAAAAVYVYRDTIAEQLTGPVPTATTEPEPTPSAPPVVAEDAALAAGDDAASAGVASADPDAASTPAAADSDASSDAAIAGDAGHADAGRTDAGARDAGARDAGRDSGARGGARQDAGRAPKHP